jgi:hypothetical protein
MFGFNRRQSAAEATMLIFHRLDERRTLVPPTEAENRLTLGQAAVVIVGFSALSWAVLISTVVVLARGAIGPEHRFYPSVEQTRRRLRSNALSASVRLITAR